MFTKDFDEFIKKPEVSEKMTVSDPTYADCERSSQAITHPVIDNHGVTVSLQAGDSAENNASQVMAWRSKWRSGGGELFALAIPTVLNQQDDKQKAPTLFGYNDCPVLGMSWVSVGLFVACV
ncbi:hypothetical protein SAY87_015537 [Trapa incisa]|uniref:Uncharacterized protein n=1 Tax=Trapa incisa TaxID=236973 RepID=A0AAN7GQA2_9MYRT|nr:hypothetical protein SAY87_015537 [Trapa incisa]